MARKPRTEIENAIYHVMNRGLARENIVFNQEDFSIFERGIREIHEDYEAQIYAYCLMSNHFHILLRIRKPNLSRLMRHFSHCLAQRVNRRLERDGPVFRGRFKSILVDNQSYLTHLVRYIHLNPVKANITKNAEDYAWSSAKYFAEVTAPFFLSKREILQHFSSNQQNATQLYRAYLEEGNRLEIENFYSKKSVSNVLNQETLLRSGSIS